MLVFGYHFTQLCHFYCIVWGHSTALPPLLYCGRPHYSEATSTVLWETTLQWGHLYCIVWGYTTGKSALLYCVRPHYCVVCEARTGQDWPLATAPGSAYQYSQYRCGLGARGICLHNPFSHRPPEILMEQFPPKLVDLHATSPSGPRRAGDCSVSIPPLLQPALGECT